MEGKQSRQVAFLSAIWPKRRLRLLISTGLQGPFLLQSATLKGIRKHWRFRMNWCRNFLKPTKSSSGPRCTTFPFLLRSRRGSTRWVGLGRPFRYRADGTPEGLLAGKRALVIVASGGNYDERSGTSALDHEIPYLRFIFGFMGITDLHFMHAGGTNAVMKGRISADDFLAPYIDQIAVAV